MAHRAPYTRRRPFRSVIKLLGTVPAEVCREFRGGVYFCSPPENRRGAFEARRLQDVKGIYASTRFSLMLPLMRIVNSERKPCSARNRPRPPVPSEKHEEIINDSWMLEGFADVARGCARSGITKQRLPLVVRQILSREEVLISL